SEIEEKQESMLSDAEKEAEERKKELIQKAREEVDQKQKHWYESLQKQKQAFLNDLRVRTGEQVFEAVRKTLKELADEDLEKHIITTFLNRIQDLEKDEKKEFSQSLSESDHAAKIRSRFELSKTMKQKIEKTVKDTFSKDVQLEFKTSDEMIGGIELESNNRKIAWNIESYLSDLENNIAESFEQRSSNENRSKGSED
ncbi:MAG: F0F1 ATP synthase subunit delta, partial [Candidatus Aminicenantes bacterium]|nr:F0F1 ATP synthase subunit delta [Candidatus Aminicenantes bacterium]